MASWLDRLKADPVDWLLEKACPSIRMRVLREILGRPSDDPDVYRSREQAGNFKPAVSISRRQKENGTWLDKVLEFEAPNPSRNRGPGLVNQFLALVEYGWDRTHPIVHCTGELLMRYLVEDPSIDLFELKGYTGDNERVTAAVRRDLADIAAALLARSGYAGEPAVVARAGRVLGELEAQYPEHGLPDLYDGEVDIEEEGRYRRIREGAHIPDMFLYYLMGFHPQFTGNEGARKVVGRVTDHLMRGDELTSMRLREVEGRRYLKLSDLPIGHWTREDFAAGKVGYLLHDLELLARTGTLVRSPKAVELLDWLISLQSPDGIFHLEGEIEKFQSRSQYHYFPLEDSWRGKHKRYTDVTFRVLLILKTLDRTAPPGS